MLASHGQAAALSTSYVWVSSALQLRMLPITQTTGERPSSARAEGEQGSLRRYARGSPLTSWSFWNPKANSKDRAHREILGVLRRGYPELREADSSEPGPSKIKPVVSWRRKLMWKFHLTGWTPSVCVALGHYTFEWFHQTFPARTPAVPAGTAHPVSLAKNGSRINSEMNSEHSSWTARTPNSWRCMLNPELF